MKTTCIQELLAIAFVGVLSTYTFQAVAQTEPLGGQPAPGAKPSVPDLQEQVVYQRAFEAVIWSQPLVGLYSFRHGFDAVGVKENNIMAMSHPCGPQDELLTANNNTPYVCAYTDLHRGGRWCWRFPPPPNKATTKECCSAR